MPRKFNHGDAARLAKIAGLTLLLPGCLTNSPKAVVTDASVTESKIAGDAVTTDKIKNGTIGTVDLADASITTAKIASGVAITGSTSSWSGAVTMASTLAVTGNTTVTGNATVGGTMGVTGNSTLTGNLTVNGVTALGNSSSADTTDILGATTVTRSTTLSTAATNFPAIFNSMTANPAADTSAQYFGSRNFVDLSPTTAVTNATASAYGSYNYVTHSSASNYRQMVGAGARVTNANTATTTNAIGVESAVLTTAGTVTNGMAFRGMRDISAGGAITNYVGLYLQDPEDPTNGAGTALGTTLYGVFSDGANAKNFFEGNVGVNVANPTFKLDVDGTIRVQNISAETNGSALCVEVTGEITNGGAGCAASDRRLKKNIQPVKGALEKVAALNGVTFEWKDPAKGSTRQIGLIAQDVLPQFPEAVEKNSKGYYHVNYEGLVGPVVEAIKELYVKWTSTSDELKQQKLMLGQLERKLEIENLALKAENKQLKDRLDKIEHALASIQPQKQEKKGRKLASQ
jgi:hypothetical protein